GSGLFKTGTPVDLQLTTGANPPSASTRADFGINLPANASVPVNPVFDPADPSSFNHTTSVTVYDSLGASHTATVYFIKDPAVNTWNTEVQIGGTPVAGASQIIFNPDGSLNTPAGGLMPLAPFTPGTGAADINLSLDFASATQFGSNFGVNSLSQDGFTTGRLTGVSVDAEGIVFARFTNGQSTSLGKLALANFVNPQGLQQIGDTAWAESFQSGSALLGEAGTASFGSIQSGALEASNVDLTAQLVQMITAQRNFQANAQMISTADAVTQTVINIR
ncbi:MAG: flagellar hook protein FlgE, partial [Woeseiaceae bacterium]